MQNSFVGLRIQKLPVRVAGKLGVNQYIPDWYVGETEAFLDAVKQLIFLKEERLRWGAKSLERVKDFEIEDISFRKEMIPLQ